MAVSKIRIYMQMRFLSARLRHNLRGETPALTNQEHMYWCPWHATSKAAGAGYTFSHDGKLMAYKLGRCAPLLHALTQKFRCCILS